MSTITLPFRKDDPLGIAIFAAAALHLLVILGVEFDFLDPSKIEQPPRSLDVTLVQSKSKEAPKEADYLAQANQIGGGMVEKKVRPTSPPPTPKPRHEQRGEAARSQQRLIPEQQVQQKQQRLLTTQQSDKQISVKESQREKIDKQLPSPAQMLMRSRQIDQAFAELREIRQITAQKPRERYITANTREYTFASYENSWRQKIERIGNLNYPEEAKRKSVSGTLLLDVAIKPDGSLADVKVIRSSGNQILDDGAIYIVKLAAPFAPFTPEIRKQVDILHITRSWQFKNNNRLETYR
ncbi:MAG: energy transducer TonB [Gammaproteobacteria bacterium]|nr:energy transducer TonB [Gammaproteobacteria bacterium]